MKRIKFTDVTLREARAQNMSFKEMIELAKVLDRLNVDVISTPPIINEKVDSLLVRTIASAVKKSTLSIPVGYTEAGVDTAFRAVSEAAHARLYIEAPMSAVQMEYICGKKPAAVIEMIKALVKKAKTYCSDVEFAAVDATRGEPQFLYSALSAAIESGASVVTICDSAGQMLPDEFYSFIKDIYANVPAIFSVDVSVKCSDALFMGTACAMAGVQAGAGEIDVTVSGSAGLEQTAAVFRARGDSFGITSNLKHTELHRAIAQLNWITRGKKTEGVINVSSVPDDITLSASDDITAVSHVVRKLGYDLSAEDMASVFETFSNVAQRKSVGVKELEAIIATSALQVPPTYELVSFIINSGNLIRATANVHCRCNGEDRFGLAAGDGPISAAFMAIEQMTGHHYELDDFQIQSVTEGSEAVGSTLVKIRSGGKLYSGKGLSTDIIGASIRAYINALNKICYDQLQIGK